MKINYINFFIINSPWPILLILNSTFFIINLNNNINKNIFFSLLWIIFILIISVKWINNSDKEITLLGIKSNYLFINTKLIIILIIIREIIFFYSFFYINFSIIIFNNWIFNFNFYLNIFKLNFLLSFINLIILLTSRITFIISINLNNINKIKSIKFLNLTIILGIYFIFIQIIEYKFLNFNISNSIFFSNFYLLTVFHINHVIIGILIIFSIKLNKIKFLWKNINKIKALCWYWHFIDLIWLIIFLIIYLYFININ